MWEFDPAEPNPSIVFEVRDDTGLPVEGLQAADLPTLYLMRPGSPSTIIAPVDLATAADPWTASGVIHLNTGEYRLDLPASVAAVTPHVAYKLSGEASNKRVICSLIAITRDKAIKAKTDLIGSGNATIVSPLNETADLLTIVPGDNYSSDGGNAIEFEFDAGNIPDLTNVDVFLSIDTADQAGDGTPIIQVEGDVLVGSAVTAQSIRFEIAEADTELLREYFGVKCVFDVSAEYGASGASSRSIVRGDCKILKQVYGG